MKKINIYYILALLFAVSFAACEDTNENLVKERGVAVVPKISNIGPGFYTTDFGNSYIKFDIDLPEGQKVDDAEIQATFKGKTTVIEKITSFPATMQIIAADVISKMGISDSDVELGDSFIIDVVTTSGGVITRSYTGSIKASVTCELIIDDFVGTHIVSLDEWDGGGYQVEVKKISETELSVEGMFDGAADPMTIIINPIDHSISVPKQVLVPLPTWWGAPGVPYKDFSLAGVGTLDACAISLSFSAEATVDAGSFGGGIKFKIGKETGN